VLLFHLNCPPKTHVLKQCLEEVVPKGSNLISEFIHSLIDWEVGETFGGRA
jgi:hypothetical protein